jgi:hypothetical protein
VSVSGTKYPLMSSTSSVSLEAKKHAAPLLPAGRIAATAFTRPSMEFRFDASGWGCPQGNAVRNPSGPWGTTVIFNAYACAVVGIPHALLGMANALAAAWPCRKGAPNGPAGLRVSAMRQGVTGTKLKPVIVDCPMNPAEAVFPASKFSGVITGAEPVGAGVAVGEGLGTVLAVAKGRARDVAVGLGVPTLPPPQPAKEKTMRDKQINETFPETKKECWRRIDFPSEIKGQQAMGAEHWIITNFLKMSIGLIDKILFSSPLPEAFFSAPLNHEKS